MGTHGNPWVPMGTHGNRRLDAKGALPWAPKGALPWEPTPSNPIPFRTPPSGFDVFHILSNKKMGLGGLESTQGTYTSRLPKMSRERHEKLIFMTLGILGKSLHHRIPPNWSSDLQLCLRISLKARDFRSGGIRRKLIWGNDPPTKTCWGKSFI